MKKILLTFLILFTASFAKSHPWNSQSLFFGGGTSSAAIDVLAAGPYCMGLGAPAGTPWVLCSSIQASGVVGGPITSGGFVLSNTCCMELTAFDAGDEIDLCVAQGDADDAFTTISGTCVHFTSGDAADTLVCKQTRSFAPITDTNALLTIKIDNVLDTTPGAEQVIYPHCIVQWMYN